MSTQYEQSQKPQTTGLSYDVLNDNDFMGPRMRGYFRVQLEMWRSSILKKLDEAVKRLCLDQISRTDVLDGAAEEVNRMVDLSSRERYYKLISKIDVALKRLDDGTYGYCAKTGKPISVKRLCSRPIAIYDIEVQEEYETNSLNKEY